jgi:hypothetical protein
MTGELEIREALDSSARKRFLDLPFRLHRADPNWVAPLRSEVGKIFARKTACFLDADMALFLAERGGRPVGRIAAIHNKAHNRQHGDKLGFFGFFECEGKDQETAKGLVKAAENWLAAKGLDAVRGPVNPSMNAECGLLIEGFDRPPVALMPYNPDSYPGLLESAGLAKCKDLFAYLVSADVIYPGTDAYERIVRTTKILQKRHPEVTVRTIDLKNYQEDILKFMGVFEEAREKNWGYVPVSKEEILETAKGLKMVADPEIILFAEVDGNPAGASIGIPDINQALAKINGRLFPFGFIKLFLALKKVDVMRIFGVGALQKYRHLGITALLFMESLKRALRKGYKACEASWVLEDNVMSNRTIDRVVKPVLYKKYRIYEKSIQTPS